MTQSILAKTIDELGKKPVLNPNIKNVAVGLSGGVDSSVAALLLKELGYNVHGVYMNNWDENEERGVACTSKTDLKYVEDTCSQLDIPLTKVDFVSEYWDNVFYPMIEGYKSGITPNPDILCNSEIKFKRFYTHCRENLNMDAIATGHYAQIAPPEGPNDYWHLLAGVHRLKDQSYWLSRINSSVLENVLFPLGSLFKSRVREIANECDLPAKARPDSVGICMIGPRHFDKFLLGYIEPNPGPAVCIKTKQRLANHRDFSFYTIGQSAGIDGNPEKYYVAAKNMEENILWVCPAAHKYLLNSTTCYINDVHWLGKDYSKEKMPLKIQYRTRNTSPLMKGTLSDVDVPDINSKTQVFSIHSEETIYAPALGQTVAIYRADRNEVVGAGFICQTDFVPPSTRGIKYYPDDYKQHVHDKKVIRSMIHQLDAFIITGSSDDDLNSLKTRLMNSSVQISPAVHSKFKDLLDQENINNLPGSDVIVFRDHLNMVHKALGGGDIRPKGIPEVPPSSVYSSRSYHPRHTGKPFQI